MTFFVKVGRIFRVPKPVGQNYGLLYASSISLSFSEIQLMSGILQKRNVSMVAAGAGCFARLRRLAEGDREHQNFFWAG